MEGESGVTLGIIDELGSSNWQGDQLEGERGFTRSIIDELHSTDNQKRSNGRRKWFYWKYR